MNLSPVTGRRHLTEGGAEYLPVGSTEVVADAPEASKNLQTEGETCNYVVLES